MGNIAEIFMDRLSKVRYFVLDMDGTIYLGDNVFPFTLDFLSLLRRRGTGFSFLTNNPTRSVKDYLVKLAGMGIKAGEENVYTSSLAAIDWLRREYPKARRLFMLGTPSMAEQFAKAGYEACGDSAEDVPDALVVAFDPTLTYPRLCRAAWWAAKGIPYLATNPDRVCPTEKPTVLVDCGSLQECIAHAVGRRPDVVLGKPDPRVIYGIMDRYSLRPEEVAVVGDRLYTDIEMARRSGVLGILVLSGETTPETAAREAGEDVLVVDDVSCLGKLLEEAGK